MTSLQNKTCLVCDLGLWPELALRLSRDFSRTFYYAPWRSAFPRQADASAGEGLSDVRRVYDLYDVLDDIDLWVFPDIGFADMQQWLRRRGHRVWGAGASEALELDRVYTRRLQQRLGVAAPPSRCVVGVHALAAELAATSDEWVKLSLWRGDMETWHHERPWLSEVYLDDLERRLGPLADSTEFIVEGNVEGVELAYDGWAVDGAFPPSSLFGYEVKDRGYVGAVKDYAALPESLRSVNDAFAPVLAEGQCRSFASFELRLTPDGEAVLIDPCMRCGSPPFQASMELWDNLAEVFWEGAAGNLIPGVATAKYAALAVLRSPWAAGNWMPLGIPPEVRRWVKLANLTAIRGRPYCVPVRSDVPEVTALGAVVGLGDTLAEALERAQDVADVLEGPQLEVTVASLEDAQEAIEAGKALGVAFD